VSELDRDPRMGRNEEAFTEDPYLYSRMIGDIVRAVQGTDISAGDKTVALLTDFPTQSEPESGLERGAVQVSERSLRENYLLPWVAGISKAGALGVMAGYPDIEDVPAHASEKWTNDVLRQELGFRGVVVSEGGGFGTLVYENLVRTQKEAGELALKSGVDVDITYEPAYMGPLIENVQEGRVPISLVDRAVRRVLELKFRLGLFEKPYVDVQHAVETVHSKANQDLALRAGREGIVLLKDDNNFLPLKKNLKSIAIIGPNADNAMNQLGDYSPHKVPQHVTTIAEGIRAKAGSGTKVLIVKGCGVLSDDRSGFAEAIRAAKGADVAIVVAGENEGSYEGSEREHATDGEGHDVASLDLTGVQEDLIKAVSQTGTPTVVVLVNGRPLSTRWTAEHVPAIVEAWRPGERGGDAVADVLFGDFNPSGRLAITIPRHVGQLPAYYNYMPGKGYWINQEKRSYADMPATPLFAFGYGLSYTSYEYSNLHIEPAQVRTGGTAHVSLEVKNTGSRHGVETVQLYTHRLSGPVATPVKQLRGFDRVSLEPGETKQVTMALSPEDFQLLDRDMHWRVVPGDIDIMVGRSSDDLPLKGTLEIIQ
jgi:beta-glucosidase